MSMPDASGVATPTAAERQLAHRIWNDVLCNSEVPGWRRDDLLAQALADQRAKYEAVADQLEKDIAHVSDIVGKLSMREAAKRIQQVDA